MVLAPDDSRRLQRLLVPLLVVREAAEGLVLEDAAGGLARLARRAAWRAFCFARKVRRRPPAKQNAEIVSF